MDDEQLELNDSDSDEYSFWDEKKDQAHDAARAVGDLVGGDDKTGGLIIIGLLVTLGLSIYGNIKSRSNRKKQIENERLYQETLKKQDAQIQGLKQESSECRERQKHYEDILEAYSANKREEDSGEA